LAESLNTAFEAVNELDLSEHVAENFKKDFKAAFEVKAAPRAGYEPGKIAPAKVSVLDLISNPAEAAWETLSNAFEVTTVALDTAWREPEKAVWEKAFEKVWLKQEGEEVVPAIPYIVQEATQRWTEKTGIRITRIMAESKGLRNNPGLTRMMAQQMSQHYSAIPVQTANIQNRVRELTGIIDKAQHAESVEELKIKLHKDTRTEVINVNGINVEFAGGLKVTRQDDGSKIIGVNGIDGALKTAGKFEKSGDHRNAEACWKAGGDSQGNWGKNNEGDSERTIREFEYLSSVDKKFAATPEAWYWSYWKQRNLHYQTLNLLGTYKKDGLSGVARFYAWMPIKNWAFKEGTWRYYLYAPNVINKLREKTVDRLLKPVLNKLTDWSKVAARIWKNTVGKWAKGLLLRLGEKLGLKALGAAIGSAIPGAGTAVGVVIGAVLQFVADAAVKKIVVPIFRILAYAAAAMFFYMVGTVGLVILIAITLSNTLYPWEQGGSAAGAQRFVQIEVRACAAAGCSYQNPLRVSNGRHAIRWRVVIKNISSQTLTGSEFTFSQGQCSNLEVSGFDLAAGGERVITCASEFTETDDVVSNVLSFSSTGPVVNEESVGIVIFGNPPAVLPTGWPVASGCISQGPDGPFSHGNTEAIDIGIGTGTAVRATFNGIVQQACWKSGSGGCDPDGYGNYVRLSSLDGSFSAIFGHLASTSVDTGDPVIVGQQLGTVDSTGHSTGAHLHYEFRGLPMSESYIPRDTGSNGSIRGCNLNCGLCF
jgi:hypothetical protein